MIGSTLGAYLIVERLGGGGFSTVYKATDSRSGQVVAIKILREEYTESAEFLRRFRREAETALGLPDNANIARTLEYGVDGGTPYLVMEFLDGRDLSAVLDGARRLPVADVLVIGRQVANALQTAHSRGVVHRDIKPQNIRLTGSGIVKVMDFGIARPMDGTRLTVTGAFIGTPAYMPPEVWEGRAADARSDIYALGVVLFESLTGRVPFDGTTPADTMRQHLEGRVAAFPVDLTGVPAGLRSIVLKAIAREPAHRFASARDLISALRAPERSVVLPPPTAPRKVTAPRDDEPAWRPIPGPAGAGVSQAYLLGSGSQFPLKPGATIVGRDPRSDIALQDRLLSGQHARIELRGRQYVLRDLGSTNGTYVNGRRVQARSGVALRHGDSLQIGQMNLTFVQSAMSGAAPAARAVGTDDPLWSALCHASALLTIATIIVPLLPVVVPVGIWLLAARHSPSVSFHARQAALYQALVMVLLIVAGSNYLTLIWLATTAFAWFGAVCCAQGRDFQYPLLGALLAGRR